MENVDVSWVEEVEEVLGTFAVLAVVQHNWNNRKDHHSLVIGGKEVIESSVGCNSRC